MLRYLGVFVFGLAASLLALDNPNWHHPFPAFRIAGNLYYVGTADLAVYLVQTPQGNILISSDFEQDVPLIQSGFENLASVTRIRKSC
jgi:metallo-beta-lactamase class B